MGRLGATCCDAEEQKDDHHCDQASAEMDTAEGLLAEELGDAEKSEDADVTADGHEQDAFDDSAFNEAFEEAYAEGQEEHMVHEGEANAHDQSTFDLSYAEDGEVIGG